MKLEIKKYPEPVLRKKAGKIGEITPEIKKLGQDMIETILKSEPQGVGLAGPQVGVSKRIIVAQTAKGPAVFNSRLYDYAIANQGSGERRRAMVLINPEILKKSRQTEIMEEGCLSLPGILVEIKRAREITIEALDINGKKSKIKAKGILARILQHEIDHLDGVLITNRVNLWQRFKSTLKR